MKKIISTKQLTSLVDKTGEHGWKILIAIYAVDKLVELCNDTMNKGYDLKFKVNTSGIEFDFKNKHVAS